MYNSFLILGNERSGTTYLQTLLASHPEIVSHGEVFHLLSQYYRDRLVLNTLINDPIEFLRSNVYKSYPKHVRAVGFKSVYSELGGNSVFLSNMETRNVAPETQKRRTEFSQYMHHNYNLDAVRERFDELLSYLVSSWEMRIVHIKRNNLLNSYISKRLAERSGNWTSTKGNYGSEPLKVDPEECRDYFEQAKGLEKHFEEVFADHHVFTLIYEDLVTDVEGVSSGLLRFLGVDEYVMTSPLEKQNRKPGNDWISNYYELKRAFAGEKWSRYFDDDI